jgi:hypothetical protein
MRQTGNGFSVLWMINARWMIAHEDSTCEWDWAAGSVLKPPSLGLAMLISNPSDRDGCEWKIHQDIPGTGGRNIGHVSGIMQMRELFAMAVSWSCQPSTNRPESSAKSAFNCLRRAIGIPKRTDNDLQVSPNRARYVFPSCIAPARALDGSAAGIVSGLKRFRFDDHI